METWMVYLLILFLFLNTPWGIRLIVLAICVPADILDGFTDSPRRYLDYFLYGE